MASVKSIVISSGHGTRVPGASGLMDEVVEATRIVDTVADKLRLRNVPVQVFHDTVSTSVNENLHRIVDFHNGHTRDLDVSVHLNSDAPTKNPVGTECLYVTQEGLAEDVAEAISGVSGLIDRGGKFRGDLYFLNETEKPAILIEVCFLDSEADVLLYRSHFQGICATIANVISGQSVVPPPGPRFAVKGRCSSFGGPEDTGVAAGEPLAFYDSVGDAPQLFLPYQPEGTTGLARRLNPYVHYVACRWNYDEIPKDLLRSGAVALVRSAAHPERKLVAFPADWGPNADTGRVADLSPSLMSDLGLHTDEEVEVVFPYRDKY